jgi:methyl-accepting chemotaxis protein
MNRNVHEAVGRSAEISATIGAIAGAAATTSGDAETSLDAVGELSRMATELRGLVSRFRVTERSEGTIRHSPPGQGGSPRSGDPA